jgi:hypothetical protein
MGARSTITLASAADLLVRWWPQLRRREHEPCGPCSCRRIGVSGITTAVARGTRYQRFKPTRDHKAAYAIRQHAHVRWPPIIEKEDATMTALNRS